MKRTARRCFTGFWAGSGNNSRSSRARDFGGQLRIRRPLRISRLTLRGQLNCFSRNACELCRPRPDCCCVHVRKAILLFKISNCRLLNGGATLRSADNEWRSHWLRRSFSRSSRRVRSACDTTPSLNPNPSPSGPGISIEIFFFRC